jgi:signal transduction histidine kinase
MSENARGRGSPRGAALPPLRVFESFCLFLSLAWAVSAILAEMAGWSLLSFTSADLARFCALVALLAALNAASFALRPRGRAELVLVIQAAAALALAVTSPPEPEIAVSLALLFALPAAVYPRFPRCLAWSAGGTALIVAIRFAVLSPAYMGQAGSFAAAWPYFILVPAAVLAPACLAAPALRDRDRLGESLLSVMKVNLSFQDYSAAIEERSMLEERLRLSRDIHDSVGYALTNAIMTLEAARIMAKAEPEKMDGFIGMAREGAEKALADVRSFLTDLRRRDVRTVSGPQALLRTVETFRRAASMEVDLDFGGFIWDLDEKRSMTVQHFVQEGMLNAFIHGKAKRVAIRFTPSGGILSVNLRDDGGGAREVKEGVGLSGMRERLEALGGSLECRNAMDGFSLTMRVPERAP